MSDRAKSEEEADAFVRIVLEGTEDAEQYRKVLEIVKNFYVTEMTKMRLSLHKTELFRLASDFSRIRSDIVAQKTIKRTKILSDGLRNDGRVEALLDIDPVSEEKISAFLEYLDEEYQNTVTAVVVADVVFRSKQRIWVQFFIGILISLIVASIGIFEFGFRVDEMK